GGCERPGLLVPAGVEPPSDGASSRWVLVALDGSTAAEAALRPAGELARALGSGLMVLRLVEPAAYDSPIVYAWRSLRGDEPISPLATARAYVERVAFDLRSQGQAA